MDGGGPIQPIQALSGGLKRFPGHRAPLLSEIPIAFERNADKNIVTDSCVGLWRVASIGITAASTCKRARSTCFGVSNYWGARSRLIKDAGRTDRNRAYGHLGIPCRRHACLSEVSEMPCSHVAHSLVKSCRRCTWCAHMQSAMTKLHYQGLGRVRRAQVHVAFNVLPARVAGLLAPALGAPSLRRGAPSLRRGASSHRLFRF